MFCNARLLAQFLAITPSGEIMLRIVGGLVILLVLFGLFLFPLYLWRRSVRRRGYPGLRAYLRALPQTEEERFEAVDLTLKGGVLCILGLLFPPLVVIGLVPLYYGARKLLAVKCGIAGSAKNLHDHVDEF